MDTATTVTYWTNGFWLNGQWYPLIQGADDSGSGEGSGDSSEGDNSGGTSAGNEGEGGDEGKSKEEKTFTQEEVNALLAKEVSKAKRGKIDPATLGFKDQAELEATIKAQRDREEQDKSDQEKAIEAARKEGADETRKALMGPAQTILIKAEFKVAASAAGVPRAALDDAYAVAQNMEDWGEVKIDDNGNVVGLDDDFFKTFKEAKPWLFPENDESGGGDIGAGSRNGGSMKDVRRKELEKRYPALRPGGRS